MNVWLTESSMLHMKTKSVISGCVLVSKKDFESEKGSSALSSAERMTVDFKGIEKEEQVEQVTINRRREVVT